MRIDFRTRLERSPLLFDGGVGTTLYERGVSLNACFDHLNRCDAAAVRAVHEAFLEAGAEAIETNTFGANPVKLEAHGLAEACREINLAGARIAREAAGEDRYVAGAIGPLGVRTAPLGRLDPERAKDLFLVQARALAEGGVDCFLCETFIYVEELALAVRACREAAPDLTVIAQATLAEHGGSLTGAPPEELIRELLRIGADAVGVNCSVGPHAVLEWLERAAPLAAGVPLSVMPNAGRPRGVDGRNIYLSTPEYLAAYTGRFLEAGARIVGGCCGVSPRHLKAMSRAFRAATPRAKAIPARPRDSAPSPEAEPVPVEKKSRLAARIAAGEFVTMVEVVSPRGVSPVREIETARKLRALGVDAVNIPDGPRAMARMSALALALRVHADAGIETVLHFTCRDRNVIGMQGDLLGAWALGVRNLLAVTGDPPKLGNYPDATAVFDVDSIGLVHILSRLNRGLDAAGDPIGEPTGFFIAVGANPGAIDPAREAERLHGKLRAGAECVITQPVFDPEVLERFLERAAPLPAPVVAGVWPLQSLRNAEFLRNEVPGCDVPDRLIERLAGCRTREEARDEGIAIARETFRAIRGLVRGVQVAAPFGRTEAVTALLEEIRSDQRETLPV
ncbi:MAG: bifunctional homocysteine S-methyltransferase/methylenetetrahydrofolate reductase [Candidatus Eisenbacteria bacterium]|nr:bifunctional homocysteine S-methyltransferase/methylenetetrahydrofolate reductase [Candidatus Eisenbacteria bacterium]